MRYQLIKEIGQFILSDDSSLSSLSLADCLDRRSLISPDTKKNLIFSCNSDFLQDETTSYFIKYERPLLDSKKINQTSKYI
jgi:hypothetical protein